MDDLMAGWRCLEVTRDGARVEVRLNRPDARNALNAELMSELTGIARRLRRRTDVAVVILCGAERYFSAGADLAERRATGDRPATRLELRAAAAAGPDMCQAWAEIEAVTIAAIEGYAIGGACALAVACDFRVMAEDGYFRLPEVPLGINMSWGTVPRLVALMGPARAKRFVMLGEALAAGPGLASGLVDEVAPTGQALAAARALADKLSALPPLPVRITKETVNALVGWSSGALDRDPFVLTSLSEDFREGVQAFFDKRPGAFKGD